MRKLSVVAFLSFALLTGCPEAGKTTSGSNTGNGDAASKPTDTGKGADAGAKPADDKGGSSSSSAANEIFWKDAGVGSVYESHMVNDMKKPAEMKMESTTTQTLKAKDDKGYTLSGESKTTMMGNTTTTPMPDQTIPWPTTGGETAKSDAKVQDLGEETVKAAGSDYKCKHYKTEMDMGGVKGTTESWMYKGLVVKSVTTSENGTMTMEMTKLEKK